MCSLAVPVAYSTFSKRITYLNYVRIYSTSEVTYSFPLQLNTADLYQQQLCDGLSPGDTDGWRAGCRSWGPWGNDWHSQPDCEQLWGCKSYAGPLFQSHASEKCRASLQLIHCPPRNRTTWRTGVDEIVERTNQMRQKQRLLGITRQITSQSDSNVVWSVTQLQKDWEATKQINPSSSSPPPSKRNVNTDRI